MDDEIEAARELSVVAEDILRVIGDGRLSYHEILDGLDRVPPDDDVMVGLAALRALGLIGGAINELGLLFWRMPDPHDPEQVVAFLRGE